MSACSRAFGYLETGVRGMWLGGHCVAFVLMHEGYGEALCTTARYIYSARIDSLAFGFLETVFVPASVVPMSFYGLPGWFMDLLYSIMPRVAEDIESVAVLTANYYIGATGLALVGFVIRRIGASRPSRRSVT